MSEFDIERLSLRYLTGPSARLSGSRYTNSKFRIERSSCASKRPSSVYANGSLIIADEKLKKKPDKRHFIRNDALR